MKTYFFDTSALQYKYVGGTFSRRIRRVISNRRSECYIADVTVLEIFSAFAKTCRRERWSLLKYDNMSAKFWADLSKGRLQVCTTGKRDLLRATNLMRFAGVTKRKNLASADALIAVCCLDLALEKQEEVVFYLEDKKLFETLQQINAFRSSLKMRHLTVKQPAQAQNHYSRKPTG
jgi:hypothetical protein